MLTFVHISDTHIHWDVTYQGAWAEYPAHQGGEALVKAVNSLPFEPDFVLHTGDVTYDPDPLAYDSARDMLRGLKAPIHYLVGNHDDRYYLQKVLLERPTSAIEPFYHYDFDCQGVQIVCLDTNGPATPPAGFLMENQLKWLDAICQAKDERPLVVAMHHNPVKTPVPWLNDYMGLMNSELVHQVLLKARHRLRGVFFGHVHQNLDIYRDGILYCSTVSSWLQFNAYPDMVETQQDKNAEPGFSVVTITDEQTFVRRWRFAKP